MRARTYGAPIFVAPSARGATGGIHPQIAHTLVNLSAENAGGLTGEGKKCGVTWAGRGTRICRCRAWWMNGPGGENGAAEGPSSKDKAQGKFQGTSSKGHVRPFRKHGETAEAVGEIFSREFTRLKPGANERAIRLAQSRRANSLGVLVIPLSFELCSFELFFAPFSARARFDLRAPGSPLMMRRASARYGSGHR